MLTKTHQTKNYCNDSGKKFNQNKNLRENEKRLNYLTENRQAPVIN